MFETESKINWRDSLARKCNFLIVNTIFFVMPITFIPQWTTKENISLPKWNSCVFLNKKKRRKYNVHMVNCLKWISFLTLNLWQILFYNAFIVIMVMLVGMRVASNAEKCFWYIHSLNILVKLVRSWLVSGILTPFLIWKDTVSM